VRWLCLVLPAWWVHGGGGEWVGAAVRIDEGGRICACKGKCRGIVEGDVASICLLDERLFA
jgi:hypothetical protein